MSDTLGGLPSFSPIISVPGTFGAVFVGAFISLSYVQSFRSIIYTTLLLTRIQLVRTVRASSVQVLQPVQLRRSLAERLGKTRYPQDATVAELTVYIRPGHRRVVRMFHLARGAPLTPFTFASISETAVSVLHIHLTYVFLCNAMYSCPNIRRKLLLFRRELWKRAGVPRGRVVHKCRHYFTMSSCSRPVAHTRAQIMSIISVRTRK